MTKRAMAAKKGSITPRLTHVKRVYLDHAATTPVDPEVAEAMARVLRDTHGNPSSIYAEGRAARELVDGAREDVAGALGAQ
ncbi:MAG: aminotransferase class V-fold PLP-dependent enzyme, partial [Candidatus Limnocylindria bacterium]